jgi:hypothetical protein
VGRFISRDIQDPHPYAYALNSPVVFVDPSGKASSVPPIPPGLIGAIAPFLVTAGPYAVMGGAIGGVLYMALQGPPHPDYANGLVNVPGYGVFYVGNAGLGNETNSSQTTTPVHQTGPYSIGSGGDNDDRRRRCAAARDRCYVYVNSAWPSGHDIHTKYCTERYNICIRTTCKIRFKFPVSDANTPPNDVY